MMLHEIIETVDQVTYKPGAQFTAYASSAHGGSLAIVVTLKCPDALNCNPDGGPILEIGTTCWYLSRDYQRWKPETLIRKIRAIIDSIEMHEVDEWFKVGGRWVTRPHKTEVSKYPLWRANDEGKGNSRSIESGEDNPG